MVARRGDVRDHAGRRLLGEGEGGAVGDHLVVLGGEEQYRRPEPGRVPVLDEVGQVDADPPLQDALGQVGDEDGQVPGVALLVERGAPVHDGESRTTPRTNDGSLRSVIIDIAPPIDHPYRTTPVAPCARA